MKKRLLSIFFIMLIMISSFFSSYQIDHIAYASSNEWQNTNLDDQAKAFLYYCKSRNLAVEGSVADALTTWSTDTYYKLCNKLGINPTSLQSDIKKATDGNTGVKFLFNSSGISAMNRIFAEFLQNNNLSVGDTVNNQNLYNGSSYQGNLLWITTSTFAGWTLNGTSSILQKGSSIVYGSTLANLYENGTFTYSAFGFNTTIERELNTYTNKYLYRFNGYPIYGNLNYGSNARNCDVNGYTILFKVNGSNALYYGQYADMYTESNVYYNRFNSIGVIENPENVTNVNINITTNNNTINNNTYENNTYTTINNEGDTYNYDIVPDPDDDPSGGGGGGGSDDPIVDPTPDPDPDIPDWDIELPDLSQNDWLLYGLEKKFPWSIPFDLMFILSILNAEPETPHFEGTVNLGVVDWEYDIDLSPFDTIAGYFREFFFLSFIIGLMYMTKQLIWG